MSDHKLKGTLFKLVGKTEDGTPVIGGVFDTFQTHGFPMEMQIDYFESKGWIVSALDIATEMFIANVKPSSIPGRVSTLFELHSPQWKEECYNRLMKIIPQGD